MPGRSLFEALPCGAVPEKTSHLQISLRSILPELTSVVQVKAVRMFTVIQKDEREGRRRKRRLVINKCCNIMRHVSKEYPTTNVSFSCNDALATALAGMLVPHGRVNCGNVNRSGVELYHIQAARTASSNTVLRPFCVRAEHSKYLTAPISLAIATPCGYWIGAMRLNARHGEFMRQ